MKVYIYGADKDNAPAIISLCKDAIQGVGGVEIVSRTCEADIAVAPLLRRILPINEVKTPRLGTMIFHPSLLPRHRGPDAIKWAYRLNEKYTGVTWFLADEGIDTGPIVAQEVLAIPEGMKPRVFYGQRVIPSAVRTLERIIHRIIKSGQIESFPQREENATYESAIEKTGSE